MKTMKDIISILDDLKLKCDLIDSNDMFYSLTLNYKNLVKDYEYKMLDFQFIKDIINNFNDDIKTFNLTIRNYGRYDENRYRTYYYNVDLVFHSGGMVFNFGSRYLSNREVEISSIDKMFDVYDEHVKSSKRLYDIIKK